MAHFLLDTDTASRLMRGDRNTVKAMRTSGARSIAVSVITQSELLYGARLRGGSPALLSVVHAFLARVTVHAWDSDVADVHAEVRAAAKRRGRAAGAFDLMIAAHARALDATLVTSDTAITNLSIDGLTLADWGK